MGLLVLIIGGAGLVIFLLARGLARKGNAAADRSAPAMPIWIAATTPEGQPLDQNTNGECQHDSGSAGSIDSGGCDCGSSGADCGGGGGVD